MTWPEAFSVLFGLLGLAAVLCAIGGGFPDIHIHKHYDKKSK